MVRGVELSKLRERFWSHVDKSGGPKACWPWTAGRTRPGYGRFKYKKKTRKAHRVACWLVGRKIPKHLFGCHKCDNTSCCNPSHIYAGTALQNARDRVRRGRNNSPLGTARTNAKLDPNKVKKIRKLYTTGKYSQRTLAKKFGVSQSQISCAVNGNTWWHVK